MKKIKNLDELNAAGNSLADVTSQIDSLTADYNNKVSDLKLELDNQVSPLKKEQAEIETKIEEYCTDNRDEVFEGAKSRKLSTITVGWRQSPNTVEITGNNKDSAVIAKIRSDKTLFNKIVKITEKIDKSAVKKAFDLGVLTLQKMRKIGLNIKEGAEKFYVKINS